MAPSYGFGPGLLQNDDGAGRRIVRRWSEPLLLELNFGAGGDARGAVLVFAASCLGQVAIIADSPWGGLALLRWLGAALVLAGMPILLEAVGRFVHQGRGTPAPWMPTECLVVTGLYRYVRNPMYLGVLSMIAGQVLLFASLSVLCYAAAVACCIVLFVRFYEEPTLRRRYGAQYATYCLNVPRWLPRWTRWRGN